MPHHIVIHVHVHVFEDLLSIKGPLLSLFVKLEIYDKTYLANPMHAITQKVKMYKNAFICILP